EHAPVLVRPQLFFRNFAVTMRLKTFGLHAVGLSSRGAGPLGARGGLLVVNVRPESPAAASGIQPGDVIETVNGRAFTRHDFGRLAREAAADPLSLGVVRLKKRINVALALTGAATPRP
nr:PDZ domain-containing protein [Acidobacteriota bacterium]